MNMIPNVTNPHAEHINSNNWVPTATKENLKHIGMAVFHTSIAVGGLYFLSSPMSPKSAAQLNASRFDNFCHKEHMPLRGYANIHDTVHYYNSNNPGELFSESFRGNLDVLFNGYTGRGDIFKACSAEALIRHNHADTLSDTTGPVDLLLSVSPKILVACMVYLVPSIYKELSQVNWSKWS